MVEQGESLITVSEKTGRVSVIHLQLHAKERRREIQVLEMNINARRRRGCNFVPHSDVPSRHSFFFY